MATPEGKTKELIRKWFKKHNINYWMPVPSAYGNTTGMSDFIAILEPSGKWLAIEAKADGKKSNTSKLQDAFLSTVNACGGVAIVVSCQSDLEELDKQIYGE